MPAGEARAAGAAKADTAEEKKGAAAEEEEEEGDERREKTAFKRPRRENDQAEKEWQEKRDPIRFAVEREKRKMFQI